MSESENNYFCQLDPIKIIKADDPEIDKLIRQNVNFSS